MDTAQTLLLAAPAMGAVLVTWLVWGVVFVALGLGVLAPAGDPRISADRLIHAYWGGMAVTIGVLQVWCLFCRVNQAAALTVVLLGAAAFAWTWRDLRPWIARTDLKSGALPSILLLVLAIWLSDRALALPGGTDSGLYHLQAVRWAHTYAATPGLANLHDRLGFNNANHLLVAMIGSGPWEGRGEYVAPGPFVLGLFASGVLALTRLWRRTANRNNLSGSTVFDLCLLAPAFLMAVGGDITSPSSDLPAAAATLAGASALFAFLEGSGIRPQIDAGDATRARLADALIITLLLGLSVCIKLSAAAFAGTAWLTMLVAWMRASRHTGVRVRREVWTSVGVAAALAVPWCARSVVLSGYAFFPSSLVSIDVSWKAPRALADDARLAITSWARAPGKPVAPSQDWRWVQDRWRQFTFAEPMSVLYPLVFAAVAGLLALALGWRTGAGWSAGVGLLLAWLVAVIVWFLGAPALRFAWHLFFIPPAVAAALVIRALARRGWVRATYWGAVVVCLALVVRVYDPLFFRPLLVAPATPRGFQPVPVPTLSVFVTRSGLRVYHAAGGDCWDAPPPCTPELRPELRLRRQGDLAGGFTLSP